VRIQANAWLQRIANKGFVTMLRLTCVLLIIVFGASASFAVELPTLSLSVQPAEIVLVGPRGVQQLIVTANGDAATIHDATALAEYRSDDVSVALLKAGLSRPKEMEPRLFMSREVVSQRRSKLR
jgi:hypothetical protein